MRRKDLMPKSPIGPPHRLGLVAMSFALFVMPAVAASRSGDGEDLEGRRVALVIGNSNYKNLPKLPNAANDAKAVSDVLKRAGFEVLFGADLDGKGFEDNVRSFLRSMRQGDVSLIYYSGHAVQVAGQNYILPVDASLTTPYDVEVKTYNLSNILSYMGQASKLQIAILDACRDNPFKAGYYYLGDKKVEVGANKGLAMTTPGLGSLIVYSTAPDQVAYDGSGELSPFSQAFTGRALTPGVEVRELVTRIRNDVIQATGGRQVPWDVSSLTTSFYLMDQQDLLVVGDQTEVKIASASEEVPLNLPVPVASGNEPLSVVLQELPKNGELRLNGAKLGRSASIEPQQLASLAYKPDPASTNEDLQLGYEVTTAGGRKASSTVKIVVEPKAEASTQVASLPPPTEPVSDAATPAGPKSIDMGLDVGTGFIKIAANWDNSYLQSQNWFRLQREVEGVQVALGERVLNDGDLIKASDLQELTVRPSISSAGETLKFALTPAISTGEASEPVQVAVNASINQCDRLAGEPLDIQGVAAGVLPNLIDIKAAIETCKEAVQRYPEIGRFKFELARALYADGQYQKAEEQLVQAKDQGHVRAAQLLGRFYQLGLNGKADPARAVPLFEQGAKVGDPYAQYSLARALLAGNGVKPDVERGMALLVKAAESGHTYAMNQLGGEYKFGRNIKADPSRSAAFFQESTDRGDVWGMVNLGLLYRDGVGVAKDGKRAMELFAQADEGGQPEAPRFLAVMMRAQGSSKPTEIAELFRKGAQRGDAWAAFLAAEMIKADTGLAKDASEATRLYALAASRGANEVSDKAMQALGHIDEVAVGKAVQEALSRLGQSIGKVDGKIGSRTLEAAASVLREQPPANLRDLLVALTRKEWLASQPRLDML